MGLKANNADDVKRILRQQGIPSSFIDKVSNIAKPLAGFIGLNSKQVDTFASQIKEDRPVNPSNNFNKEYPKI